MSRAATIATATFVSGLALSIGGFQYPRVGTVLLIVGILLYLWAALQSKRFARRFGHRAPLWLRRLAAWSEVSVSPEWFRLGGGSWSTTTSLLITSQSDEVLYSVYLELSPIGMGVKSRDIQIKPDYEGHGLLDIGPHQLSGDFRLDAVNDTERREFVLVRFYELLPGQRRRLLVRGMPNVAGRCGARILSFSYEPEAVIQQGENKGALIMRAPASMRITGIHPIVAPK